MPLPPSTHNEFTYQFSFTYGKIKILNQLHSSYLWRNHGSIAYEFLIWDH